jgi:K+-transporting ATPase ATPase C chain
VARVAKTRDDILDQLRAAVRDNQDGPDLGFLGAARVNVLEPNLELDQKHPMKR